MRNAIVVFFLGLGIALSQAITGAIFGSVTDSSGGAIPLAEIKLVSITTGAQRTVRQPTPGNL